MSETNGTPKSNNPRARQGGSVNRASDNRMNANDASANHASINRTSANRTSANRAHSNRVHIDHPSADRTSAERTHVSHANNVRHTNTDAVHAKHVKQPAQQENAKRSSSRDSLKGSSIKPLKEALGKSSEDSSKGQPANPSKSSSKESSAPSSKDSLKESLKNSAKDSLKDATETSPKTHSAQSPKDSSKDSSTQSPKDKKHTKRLKGFVVGGIAAVLVILIACFGFMGMQQPQSTKTVTDFNSVLDPSITFDESNKNPINFESLMSQNRDIYAWIYVPGTDVNYPVLQSPLADNYYLYHNMYGEDDQKGAIYTQSMNSKRFVDPVTVIYGHTFQVDDERANEAFGTLHNFEDETFMKEHPEFYIYTPEWKLTYKVVSAYVYDNRHILNTLDLDDEAVRQDYYDNVVVNPTGEIAVTSDVEGLDAGTDRIVQLSTCTRPSITEDRFIVTGVLTDRTDLEPCW